MRVNTHFPGPILFTSLHQLERPDRSHQTLGKQDTEIF